MDTLKSKNSKSITFTVRGVFFTFWVILAHIAAFLARLPCHNFVSKTTKFRLHTTSPERRCLNLRWIWGGAGGNLAFCAYAHPPLLLYSNVLDDLGCSWCSSSRAATADFWQVRPLKWQPHHRRAVAAITVFFSAKSRQDHGLGGLASRDGPAIVVVFLFRDHWCHYCKTKETSGNKRLLISTT